MALKRLDNGTYVIKTRKEAIRALSMMDNLAGEIDELEEEHGIKEMKQDAVELKKAATAFCIAKKIDRLDLPSGRWATLISQGRNRRWILTKDEITSGMPEGTKSLRSILQKSLGRDGLKEVWNRVTKRVPDPDGIQALVDEGILNEDEIAPAFVEEASTPYLRLFGKGDE